MTDRTLSMEDLATPIFDAAMGERLMVARKMSLLTQGELAEKLALSQTTVTDLELGRLAVPRFPFTISRLREVFPDQFNFILFAKGDKSVRRSEIHFRFLERRPQGAKPKKHKPDWRDHLRQK